MPGFDFLFRGEKLGTVSSCLNWKWYVRLSTRYRKYSKPSEVRTREIRLLPKLEVIFRGQIELYAKWIKKLKFLGN